MLPVAQANTVTGEPFAFAPQPLLARDMVRYVGEPVALIVAETRAQALDAAELVPVEYDTLPAVVTAAAARVPGAPLLSSLVPGNLCMDWHVGDPAAVDAAFATAAHSVTLQLDNHRIVTNPMEPRGGIGSHDPARDRYTLHVSSQNIHGNRDLAARALGVSSDRVRFHRARRWRRIRRQELRLRRTRPDLWAAKRVGRPVKWIATRSEVFLSDHQARDHQAQASLALDAGGKFLALRIASTANIGAYMVGSAGGVQTNQYAHLPGTVYAIPAIALHVDDGADEHHADRRHARGPGFAEMVNIMERLIDTAAHQCGFDRIELRRRNFANGMPMTNAFGYTVDSGDFARPSIVR